MPMCSGPERTWRMQEMKNQQMSMYIWAHAHDNQLVSRFFVGWNGSAMEAMEAIEVPTYCKLLGIYK
ncbi:hypothetical protein EYC84_006571 [Monilinia fructicola]|uniref:Uncharacterized protein n=1 Tax=Monilinia fructicola TaxID=38448 RepID=A0A5M9K8Q2_MONFR|nr:hypothetical protein EYC84_006571 [Monilinia fructicola]